METLPHPVVFCSAAALQPPVLSQETEQIQSAAVPPHSKQN